MRRGRSLRWWGWRCGVWVGEGGEGGSLGGGWMDGGGV